MRKTFAVVLILTGVVAGAPAARADAGHAGTAAVAGWNELAFAAVRATRATDADAARLYAMVNVAMYDAVNGVAHDRRHALVPGPGPHGADPRAAAVAAAHAVLTRLDPDRTSAYDTRLAADLAALPDGHRRAAGVSWGERVGSQVVAERADDGSTPVRTQPAGSGPGVFRAAWSGTQYADVRPFAVADPAAHVPGPPPALSTVDYAAAFAEVAILGNAAIPADDKLATYQFWSLPAGSSQPAGAWLGIALRVAADRHLSLERSTRLLALLGMALADTTVATVRTKATYQPGGRPPRSARRTPTATR